MTTETKHTLRKMGDGTYAVIEGGTQIKRLSEKQIIDCVNSHDDLLAALQELLSHIEWRRNIAGEKTGENDCTHRARAAIAKATQS